MMVIREPLAGTRVQRLVVEAPQESNLHVGEVVGYQCPDCRQCDETLEQIWHDRDCELAGEHGRAHYDEIVPSVPGRPTPELDPAHPITIVQAADGRKNEVLAFRCDGCGNLDEDLFEVIHDSVCALATDHDAVHVTIDCPETGRIEPAAASDGGH